MATALSSSSQSPQPLQPVSDSALRGSAMAAMTPEKHFKTGRLGFVLHTNGEWAWIYFPDVNKADWRRAH